MNARAFHGALDGAVAAVLEVVGVVAVDVTT
jgi:hypothetical protein